MTKLNSSTFIHENISNLSNKELLKHYDNPRNINVNDCRNTKWKNSNIDFPSQCLVFLTHWSFAVNEKIRRTTTLTKSQFLRLMQNFSDFWTRKMLKKSLIPNENVICFPWSRAIWDPNREYKTEEEDSKVKIWNKFIRELDFNLQKIIENPWQFRDIWKLKTDKYHADLYEKLNLTEKINWGSIWFDIHDTWINLMNSNSNLDKFRKEWFPEITLWTKEWESCNSEIAEYFAKKLNQYLWLKVHINDPFQGGYVTTKHWKVHREKTNNWNWLEKSKRNMIQVELWRYLYMKESTQEVDWERMEIIWEWIKRAITDTWIKFWKEYFESID